MKDRGETRRLTAILMADVVGYSRLMGADEAGTLATMKSQRRTLIDPTIDIYHGRIVNAPGDSLLAEFPSVVDALRCAIALQQGMSAINDEKAVEQRFDLRVGVNVGDVLVQDGSLFGDGVNVAARLEHLAEAGGICISRGVHEQIRNSMNLAFVDLGALSMKNIARPVEVFALPASVIATMSPIQAPAGPTRKAWFARWPALAAIAFGICGLWAAIFLFVPATPKPVTFRETLGTALVRALPDRSDTTRGKLKDTYLATPLHRALVLAPKSKSTSYSGEWTTAEEAADKTLERCQLAALEPCAVVAVDDRIEIQRGGSWVVRDMPRTHYAGIFDIYWVPGVRVSAIKKPEVRGYTSASGAKAIAYNTRGLLFVVTGEQVQRRAEEKALTNCNAAGTRNDVDRPCLLYAVGNQVVLPENRTTPKAVP